MFRRSKRQVRYLIVSALMMITLPSGVQAQAIEKGNPVARYGYGGILLSDGTEISIGEDYIALFVNGTFIPDDEVKVKNGRALVPVRVVSESLGCQVEWESKEQKVILKKEQKEITLRINEEKAIVNQKEVRLDEPAIVEGGTTYVPLRFIAEHFDATVNYSSALDEGTTYYYETQMPLSSADTLIRSYPNIIIDEKYDLKPSPSKEEAMKQTQEVCREGLENYKKTMAERLIESGELPDKFDESLKQIEMEIDRMMYIGEVSRYYKFTIGAYDILFDKYNENIFFEMYASGIRVKKVSIQDPELFTSVFIVG